MDVFIGIILIIVVVSIYFILKSSTKKNKEKLNVIEKNVEKSNQEKTSFFPMIQIIENDEVIPDEKNLIIDTKIKESLAMISNIAPKTAVMEKNIENVKEITKNGKVFFSASKKGTKNMLDAGENKVYGVQINPDTKRFEHQTKFTNETFLTKKITRQQITTIGIATASMVVSQYYMSEINDKLEKISNSIKEISDFQDSEYQSKLLHIVSKMEEILENKNEILSNEESRKNAYHDNKELESKCIELLGQANIQINNEIKEEKVDYKEYTSKVEKVEKWFFRQQVTQELLLKIGDLRYVLANGSETSKQCHKQYNNFLNQTNKINEKLNDWHNNNIDRFGIDIDKKRKKGNLFKLREYTIGKINDEWNYDKVKNDIIKEIEIQLNPKEFKFHNDNKQDEKIMIQKYKGEYYKLPKNKEE